MTRAEFISVWSDLVADGRQRRYPDITRAESACNSIDDAKTAAKFWRKHRPAFAPLTAAECRAILTDPQRRARPGIHRVS